MTASSEQDARALAQAIQAVIAAWIETHYKDRTGPWAAEAYTTILSGVGFVAAYHAAALNVVAAVSGKDPSVGEQALGEIYELVRTLIPVYEQEVRRGIKASPVT